MSEPGHDRFDREQPTRTGRVQQQFERILAGSRLLALIPVVFLMLDAVGSFVYGSDILLRTAHSDVGEPARIGGRLGIFLVVMDTFLVGATLMIAAFGFYELFVLRKDWDEDKFWLPKWLRMRDLEDLKARVVSMLILVAAITFVDIAVESHDERDVLFLGLGIAVVILALTAFLRWGPRSSARKSGDPDLHQPGDALNHQVDPDNSDRRDQDGPAVPAQRALQ